MYKNNLINYLICRRKSCIQRYRQRWLSQTTVSTCWSTQTLTLTSLTYTPETGFR